MQQEAFERVQQMQNRAKQRMGNPQKTKFAENNTIEKKQAVSKEEKVKQSPKHIENVVKENAALNSIAVHEKKNSSKHKGGGLGDILSFFTSDSDKTLLVILIIVLMMEKADMKLILALGYILL